MVGARPPPVLKRQFQGPISFYYLRPNQCPAGNIDRERPLNKPRPHRSRYMRCQLPISGLPARQKNPDQADLAQCLGLDCLRTALYFRVLMILIRLARLKRAPRRCPTRITRSFSSSAIRPHRKVCSFRDPSRAVHRYEPKSTYRRVDAGLSPPHAQKPRNVTCISLQKT